jgi:hypothetical protein
MMLELSPEETGLLRQALQDRIDSLQDEVAHTESYAIQVGLHRDMDALERLRHKLEVGSPAEPPAAPI